MLPQVQPSVAPAMTVTQVYIPTNHVIPNLSAWTFPAPSSIPTLHAAVPQPVRGQVTLTSTAAAPELPQLGFLHQLSQLKAEEQLFCNPLATTLPTKALQFPQNTTAPANVPIQTFPTTAYSTVPPPRPTTITFQDLAQLLTAAKEDHLPE